MTKPHITTLGCFAQVAAVLGHSRAQLELWRAVHYEGFEPREITSGRLLFSFSWDSTPQDEDFWDKIYFGIKP